MLGKFMRVHITQAYGCLTGNSEEKLKVNYGKGKVFVNHKQETVEAYVIGVTHPVGNFEGKVIAFLKREDGSKVYIVANKFSRFINYEIMRELPSYEQNGKLTCLYETSCGAVVFRHINGIYRFLLIKNKRSSNWGFPKGHMEIGETERDTAIREVMEETGINIRIYDNFEVRSNYKIHNHIHKTVIFFLADTTDKQTIIQKEEVEDYLWLTYDEAYKQLNFENDREILIRVKKYMNDLGVTL